MKKQILKALTMISLVSMLTLVAAVARVQAQSRINYTANIPFEFTVGSATLPAGEYTVTQIKTADGAVMLRLSAKGQDSSALRLTDRTQASEPKEKTVLVFNHYGEQYFLAEMWRAGEAEGRLVRKSSRERVVENELARNPSHNGLAGRGAAPETIEITAALAR